MDSGTQSPPVRMLLTQRRGPPVELLTRLPLQRRIMVLVAAGLGLTVFIASAIGLEVISQSTNRVLEERRVMAQVSATNLDDRLEASLQRLEAVGSTFRLDSVRILSPKSCAR